VTRVLVVDDEPPIVRAVAANLRVRGYEVLTVASGDAALAAVEAHQPDCVVLDLGLPGVGGLEVLRRLRTWTEVPVVVLTAIDSERDKVTALDLGADDYVTKPFGVAELMARWPPTPGGSAPTGSCWSGSGAPATATSLTTCGSTWPTCVRSWMTRPRRRCC